MKWETIKHKNSSHFKRLTGVKKSTFLTMIDEITRLSPQSAHKFKGEKRGPKPKLCFEDQLLMMLMYYREYRTFFHVGLDYGISETQCWRIVIHLERLLIKSKLFHLPGKKSLLNETNFKVILIDVAETPIERPKKSNGTTIQEKRKDTP
jgi:hypothetical protein